MVDKLCQNADEEVLMMKENIEKHRQLKVHLQIEYILLFRHYRGRSRWTISFIFAAMYKAYILKFHLAIINLFSFSMPDFDKFNKF